MVRHEITASFLGSFVNRSLQDRPKTYVAGNTSRGLYLQPQNGLVIYLSLEDFRGPLTINIPASVKPSLLKDIHPGSRVNLGPNTIHLPGSDLRIDLARTVIWQGDLPSDTLSPQSIPGRFQTIFDQATKLCGGHELLPLLDAVGEGHHQSLKPIQGISPHFTGTMKAIKHKGLTHSIESLQKLIGLGQGLTPLGDDIILGMLLTLNRWKGIINPAQDLEEFNQRLLSLAKDKTSVLSYSLFNCAAEGSGDERLLIVLDSFFSGEEPTIDQVQDFLNWGSSSGMGVLAGILAVINRFNLK